MSAVNGIRYQLVRDVRLRTSVPSATAAPRVNNTAEDGSGTLVTAMSYGSPATNTSPVISKMPEPAAPKSGAEV